MESLCTSVIANHGRRSRRLFARQSMPCLNDDDDDDDDDDERFEPRSYFKSRLSFIVRLNVVLNRTVVVDND